MPDESKIKGDGRMPYPRFVNLSVNGYKTVTSMILTAWLEKFPKQKRPWLWTLPIHIKTGRLANDDNKLSFCSYFCRLVLG
jgi:hypothetical protein